MLSDGPRLRDVLRTGTQDLHERSESAFVLAAPDVTRAEYGAVLVQLLAFHTAAESALAPWAPAFAALGLDLSAREKAPLLRQDLHALDVPVDASAAAPPTFALSTIAHALGAAYVLEGATLGGQLLRRRLGPALGLTPTAGLAFFTAYGDAIGAMWRAFGSALDHFDTALGPPERGAAHARALVGARDGFLTFERVVVRPTARAAIVRPT